MLFHRHLLSVTSSNGYKYFAKYYFLSLGMASNFDKRDSDTSFNAPYDYNSIMHYGRTSFSKNGKDTIQAKYDPYLDLGGSELSKYDIMKIKTMYRCNGMYFNGKKLSREENGAFARLWPKLAEVYTAKFPKISNS